MSKRTFEMYQCISTDRQILVWLRQGIPIGKLSTSSNFVSWLSGPVTP